MSWDGMGDHCVIRVGITNVNKTLISNKFTSDRIYGKKHRQPYRISKNKTVTNVFIVEITFVYITLL